MSSKMSATCNRPHDVSAPNAETRVHTATTCAAPKATAASRASLRGTRASRSACATADNGCARAGTPTAQRFVCAQGRRLHSGLCARGGRRGTHQHRRLRRRKRGGGGGLGGDGGRRGRCGRLEGHRGAQRHGAAAPLHEGQRRRRREGRRQLRARDEQQGEREVSRHCREDAWRPVPTVFHRHELDQFSSCFSTNLTSNQCAAPSCLRGALRSRGEGEYNRIGDVPLPPGNGARSAPPARQPVRVGVQDRAAAAGRLGARRRVRALAGQHVLAAARQTSRGARCTSPPCRCPLRRLALQRPRRPSPGRGACLTGPLPWCVRSRCPAR